MTSMSDDAVKAATGRGGAHSWVALAQRTSRTSRSRAISTPPGVPGWWAQMVTVEYERMIGRRAVGQRCDGAYSASASRTVAGDMDAALTRWLAAVGDRANYDGVLAESVPRVSTTANWRYWKVDLEDGSKVSVTICEKASGKATIGVGHEKIGDAEAAARWKLWWKAVLAEV